MGSDLCGNVALNRTCELPELLPSVSKQTLYAKAVLRLVAVFIWAATFFSMTLRGLAADELH